jgi:hypothetical protein
MPYSKYLFRLIIVLILGVRLFDLYYTPMYNPDKLEQLIAAKHWSEGHGVVKAHYVMEDELTLAYEPLIQWPPGYSIAIGLLLKTHWHIHTIVTILDMFFLILLLFFSFIFLQSLPFEWKKSLWILWAGLLLNTAIAWHLTSVDFISYTLFFGGLTLILPTDNQPRRFAGIIAGLLLGLCFWFRYAYIPQVFAVLAIGGLYQWKFNRITLMKVWVPAGLTITLLFGTYFFLFKTGNPGYIDSESKGFYFSNLGKFNLNFLSESLTGMVGIERILSPRIPFLSLLLNIVLCGGILWVLYKIIVTAPKSRYAWPILGSVIIANLLLLIYLSLTNSPQTWAQGGWTFVQENRYYAPSWIALWMLLTWYLSHRKSKYLEQMILIPFICFSVAEASLYRKWQYRQIDFSKREELPLVPDYSELKHIAIIAKSNQLITAQIPGDPYTSLVAELGGWIPVKAKTRLPEHVCLLQYPATPQDLDETNGLSLELYLKSGRIIYLINSPHLWN